MELSLALSDVGKSSKYLTLAHVFWLPGDTYLHPALIQAVGFTKGIEFILT